MKTAKILILTTLLSSGLITTANTLISSPNPVISTEDDETNCYQQFIYCDYTFPDNWYYFNMCMELSNCDWDGGYQ